MEIDKYSPEMAFNTLIIIYENNELLLCVRYSIYYEEGKNFFLVWCDMNITSRYDAYITNINSPWRKKTDQIKSVKYKNIF